MSQGQLYAWMKCIVQRMNGVGDWQVVGLALLSMSLGLAESCQSTRVAERLGAGGARIGWSDGFNAGKPIHDWIYRCAVKDG